MYVFRLSSYFTDTFMTPASFIRISHTHTEQRTIPNFWRSSFCLTIGRWWTFFRFYVAQSFSFLIYIDMSKARIDSHAFLLARKIFLENKTKRTRRNFCNPFECFRMDSLFLLKWKSKVHTTEYEHCGCCRFFFSALIKYKSFQSLFWYVSVVCACWYYFWDWILPHIKSMIHRDFHKANFFSVVAPNEHTQRKK